MLFHDEWRTILKRSWVVRGALAGAVLEFLQTIFSYFDLSFLPQWLFTLLVILIFLGLPVLRIMFQKNLSGVDDAGQ